MNMIDYIILAIIAVIIGYAVLYIRKSRKKGIQCVGCPDSAACSGQCSCCSGKCGH